MVRTLFATLIALLLFLGAFTRSTADSPVYDEPEYGNEFMCGQHALAGEVRNQPYEALLEVARVLVTKGACYRDAHWLSSWRLAQSIVLERPNECERYYSCQAYFLFETIDPAVREPLALAMHVALTESPRIPRYHFDASSSAAFWWDSPRACPNSWFILGDVRIC